LECSLSFWNRVYINPSKWEGVGISSYLLINFWFTRLQANKAAIKALITNRIGDYFFSIGLFVLFWTFGNLDYSTIFSLAPVIDQDIITIIGICLLLAAMGKSAQLGLHVWLPEAMEGHFSIMKVVFLMCAFVIIDHSSSIYLSAIIPTAFQKEVITGLLLSDGHLRNQNQSKRSTGNKRLEFTFKAASLEFMLWVK
jgi:formate hydrogenlyase subunit 3/multisubunit Na+/H+ antiporter MnhD subunit